MKTLNLDRLGVKEQRELVIGDVTHPIKQLSVEKFIATTKMVEVIEKDKSPAAQIHASIMIVQQSVPTLSESDLMQFTLSQLRGLIEFIRGDDPEAIMSSDAALEGGQEPGKE